MNSVGHAIFAFIKIVCGDLAVGWLIYIIASKKFNLDEKKNIFYVLTGFYMIRSMAICYLFLKELDKTFVAYVFLINIPFGLYNLFSPKANKKSLKMEVNATYFLNYLMILLLILELVFSLIF